MKIIYATWCVAEYQGRILTELEARDRLISYWEMIEKQAGMLASYCQSGKAGKRTKRI